MELEGCNPRSSAVSARQSISLIRLEGVLQRSCHIEEEHMSIQETQFWEDLKAGRFVSMVKEACKGRRVSDSREVYNIMKPVFSEEDDVEKVYGIFLDAQNKVLGIEHLFSGTITAATIYPREIVKRIIHLKATAFVMVHNHPSGSVAPSVDDRSITIKVGMAMAAIDVQLHDHIIVGGGYHSMADSGYLARVRERFAEVLKPGTVPEEGDLA